MRYKQTEKNRKQCKQLILSISAPNALSGFNAPKNKEGLVAVAIPTPHKHSLSCTTCKNKPTNRLQRPRKPNNSRMRQLKNSSTHQLTNSSTQKHINSSTQKLVNSKTQKIISSSTHKLINSKNHQLKNLNCYFLFYNNTLIFAAF